MSSEVIVSVRGLGKTYRIYRHPYQRLIQCLAFGKLKLYSEVQALMPCTFEVRRGECLGIIGRNGSGKSTLLQLLAGTVTPSSGEQEIHGRVAALLELGSGFNPEFTGHENIFMYGAILGLSQEEMRERYQAIVDFADIGDAIEQPVKTYSSGMAMRLAFAVVANIDADVLIIDEALAVGDMVFVQKCYAFLREFIKKHTVILVTHDINAITMLCSRTILLDKARIVADGPPRRVTERYLELCYAEKQNVNVKEEQQWTPLPADFREGGPVESTGYLPDERSFGEGGAEILEAKFVSDTDAEQLNMVRGGEMLRLIIRVKALKRLELPAVGFLVRTPEGIFLWSDSSVPGTISVLEEGRMMEVAFHFVLPRLGNGEYTVGVSVSTGRIENHIIQIWNHNAMKFKVNSSYPLQGALIGLPMSAIDCREIES